MTYQIPPQQYKKNKDRQGKGRHRKREQERKQRKAKRNLKSKTDGAEEKMHDIQKTITLDDLTNPDKN